MHKSQSIKKWEKEKIKGSQRSRRAFPIGKRSLAGQVVEKDVDDGRN